MSTRTTEIDAIRKGSHFVWGEIRFVWEVGPYVIAEYQQWKQDGATVCTGTVDLSPKATLYHVWVHGRDTHTGYVSLDAAMVGAICYRHEGPNCHAGAYFIKSLDPAKDKWGEWAPWGKKTKAA